MTIKTPVAAWFTPYIKGMNLAYATTTTFTVAAGKATNGNASADTNIITIEDAVTISTTVSGAGGLDTGSIAANTKYYVYAIGSSSYYEPSANDQMPDSDGNPYPGSALISTSTTPTLPAYYDMYRYIGTVYTNGSSQFAIFYQTGEGVERTMYYDAGISVLSAGTSTTYANINLTTAVPRPGLEVIVTTSLTPNSASSVTNLAPYGSTSTNGLAQIKGQVSAVVNTVTSRLPCTSNSGVPYILYKTTSGSDSVSMVVTGYVDQL